MGAKAKKLGTGVIPAEARAKFEKSAYGLAAVGLLACGGAAAVDAHRFAFSYLVGFIFVLSLGLGGLFFVIIQHLTKAGWSVAARRSMEWLSLLIIPSLLLFIPVLFFAHDLFHHWMGPEAANDALVQAKSSYLNVNFFYGRAAVYFVIWAALAVFFYRKSREQDESGAVGITATMSKVSAPSVLLFGLSTSFAAFDWLMSLDPHWYSTIFGVYFFAGCAVSSFAMLALMTIRLQGLGVYGAASTVEHQHDIGKMLFGFIVFWAYIGFSQFILIWYANIPEETVWYLHRWEGSWKAVSVALLFGHFIVPFLLLLSRHAKRNPSVLSAGAVLILVMHYIDLYWLVMPTLDHHGAHFSWIDLAGVLGPLGVGAAFIAKRLGDPAYPLKDPYLKETTKVENL